MIVGLIKTIFIMLFKILSFLVPLLLLYYIINKYYNKDKEEFNNFKFSISEIFNKIRNIKSVIIGICVFIILAIFILIFILDFIGG